MIDLNNTANLSVVTDPPANPRTALIICSGAKIFDFPAIENKMKPTNPNAHTYVNGTDVKTHGYAVTHNTFL